MYRIWNILINYSLLLIIGAVLALCWANLDLIFPLDDNPTYWANTYSNFVNFTIWENAPIGDFYYGAEHRTLKLYYLVNDILMALFFAIAGKEVWEALILKNGSLRGRKAATPLVATAGGMIGPITVYLGLAALLGSDTYSAVANGWAIPTATDIAFSYLVGRVVFGAGHPAVRFLLLLAIADDAAGLIILAIFYPSGDLMPVWLLFSFSAALIAFFLFNWLPRYLDGTDATKPVSTWFRRKLTFWPYLLAACASWYGFMVSGLHPALGLLPIIPAIPHADQVFGIFADAKKHLHDLLNEIEHALKIPVEIILFFFGLCNAGVQFSSIGNATWLVLAGLLIGKPVGILLFGWLAANPLKFGMPKGMRIIDLVIIGFVAAIGFTVSLFVASVAFEPGPIQDAAKMGALISFIAAIISVIAGKIFRVQKHHL
ncbi:MAG: Na+/H+ antiporter NhaA [Aestuariivita sp.]|nr:Na+/H+ antiporter NhaA [Aestuariivita sp.]